jgi:endogenous inhibitor of DNA gyrase (YacG/DUF329 family)
MNCPICRKPLKPAFRPFCSRRCADLDLGRWMTGAYAIPSEEGPEDDPKTDTGDGAIPPARH